MQAEISNLKRCRQSSSGSASYFRVAPAARIDRGLPPCDIKCPRERSAASMDVEHFDLNAFLS